MTLPFKGGHNPATNEIDVIFILLFLKKIIPQMTARWSGECLECRSAEVILSLSKEWESTHTCFDKLNMTTHSSIWFISSILR